MYRLDKEICNMKSSWIYLKSKLYTLKAWLKHEKRCRSSKKVQNQTVRFSSTDNLNCCLSIIYNEIGAFSKEKNTIQHSLSRYCSIFQYCTFFKRFQSIEWRNLKKITRDITINTFLVIRERIQLYAPNTKQVLLCDDCFCWLRSVSRCCCVTI